MNVRSAHIQKNLPRSIISQRRLSISASSSSIRIVASDWIGNSFGITQSYVQALGDLPHPAKFRERLAEAAKCPRLPFDDPEEIFAVKEFYALFAHNPVGRTFTEDHQRLGSLTFCVPSKDMRGWVTEISIPELISFYPARKAARKSGRGPTWKRRTDTGTE